MFWDPTTCEGDVLAQAIMTVSDDMAVIIEALESDEPDVEAITRLMIRARSRIDVALTLRDRYAKAAQGGKEDLWVVPDGNWAGHRVATPEDLNERGWILASEARKAVSALIADQPAATAINNEVVS